MGVTVGIDLAAEARTTAIARVDWTNHRPVLLSLAQPADDRLVVELCAGADRIGIDCPLGWPEAFVDFVERHRDNRIVAADDTGPGWRRPFVNRLTDLVCAQYTQERLGRAVRPLSVSADLLGHAALRCAVLCARLQEAGVLVDRSGVTGHVVEVYPAATLALWEIPVRGYKGGGAGRGAAERRQHLRTAVQAFVEAGGLSFAADDSSVPDALLSTSDHAFDAVVAAFAARAVHLGRATAPAPEEALQAEREGWIALPTCPIDALSG